MLNLSRKCSFFVSAAEIVYLKAVQLIRKGLRENALIFVGANSSVLRARFCHFLIVQWPDVRVSSSLLYCCGTFYAKKTRQGRFAVSYTHKFSFSLRLFRVSLLSRSAVLEFVTFCFTISFAAVRTRVYEARDDKIVKDSKFAKLAEV